MDPHRRRRTHSWDTVGGRAGGEPTGQLHRGGENLATQTNERTNERSLLSHSLAAQAIIICSLARFKPASWQDFEERQSEGEGRGGNRATREPAAIGQAAHATRGRDEGGGQTRELEGYLAGLGFELQTGLPSFSTRLVFASLAVHFIFLHSYQIVP